MGLATAVRRVAAVVLLVGMLPVTYTAAACAGWSSSAADRHACCERRGDGCAAVSADDCCADGEQRQNIETVAGILITPGVLLSEPVRVLPRSPRSFVVDPRSLAARPDTYLLDSVFLI